MSVTDYKEKLTVIFERPLNSFIRQQTTLQTTNQLARIESKPSFSWLAF